MSKWPAWVQAELDAGRISEEELDGFEVFVGPTDVHLKAVRKFGTVFWLGETWWAWENQHDNRNFGDWTDDAPPLPSGEAVRQYLNLIAALSGQPTAEVERLKQRVGELEGVLNDPQALHLHCLRNPGAISTDNLWHLLGDDAQRLKQRVEDLEGLLRELDDAGIQAIYGEDIGADDAVRDLMTYRAISDKVRQALSPDTPERGEGGAG